MKFGMCVSYVLLAINLAISSCISHLKFTLQVKALKEKIEQEKGKDTFPAGGQKLIYAGNVSPFILL